MTYQLTPAQRSRFWEQVSIAGPDDCWPWLGTKMARGYGATKLATVNRRPVGAHRMAYSLTNGDIPEGMCVCHHCDNPPCCNPAHLFTGTKSDNTRDCVMKHRMHAQVHPESVTGARNPRAILTTEDVHFIRASTLSARTLAFLFDVGKTTIKHARNGTSWSSLSA